MRSRRFKSDLSPDAPPELAPLPEWIATDSEYVEAMEDAGLAALTRAWSWYLHGYDRYLEFDERDAQAEEESEDQGESDHTDTGADMGYREDYDEDDTNWEGHEEQNDGVSADELFNDDLDDGPSDSMLDDDE